MLWTEEHAANLSEYLETHTLSKGLGTKESACSIAAINLAISGELTDNIPYCMSVVLGNVIIRLQDAMPNDMRNSARYREVLKAAPGTGREKEKERLAIMLDWMWGTILPQMQTVADKGGFGKEWREMCKDRTPKPPAPPPPHMLPAPPPKPPLASPAVPPPLPPLLPRKPPLPPSTPPPPPPPPPPPQTTPSMISGRKLTLSTY